MSVSIRFLVALLLPVSMLASEPSEVPLWPNGAPGSEGRAGKEIVRVTTNGEHVVSSVHNPSLTPYLPLADKATRAAVIIAPAAGIGKCGWTMKVIIWRNG